MVDLLTTEQRPHILVLSDRGRQLLWTESRDHAGTSRVYHGFFCFIGLGAVWGALRLCCRDTNTRRVRRCRYKKIHRGAFFRPGVPVVRFRYGCITDVRMPGVGARRGCKAVLTCSPNNNSRSYPSGMDGRYDSHQHRSLASTQVCTQNVCTDRFRICGREMR